MAVEIPILEEKPVSEETQMLVITMQFSDKKEELIGNVKEFSGSDDVEVDYISPTDSSSSGYSGCVAVTFYLDVPPSKDKLEGNLANIVTVSRQVAKESGIKNPDITVVAMLKDETTPLGVGNYYSSSGETYVHVENINV